ncbi:hypothetical protein ACM66B_004005 [Microbotryomycetes sp. NB124-2]
MSSTDSQSLMSSGPVELVVLPNYDAVLEEGLHDPPAYPQRRAPPRSTKFVYASTSDMIQTALFGSILFSKPNIFKRKSSSSIIASIASEREGSMQGRSAEEDVYLPSYEAATCSMDAAMLDRTSAMEVETLLWRNLPRGANDGRNDVWGAAAAGRHVYPCL